MTTTLAIVRRPVLRASKYLSNFRLNFKMKKAAALFSSLLSIMLVVSTADAKQVRVKGYYRKDGTYVSPHVRNVGGGSKSYRHSYSTPSYSTPSYSTPSYSTPSRGASSDNKTSIDRSLDSLPRCQAVNEDGSICKHPANPGLKYCYRHVRNQGAPKVESEENQKAKTRQWMADIDDAIKRYVKSSKGPPPESLKELQAQMGGIVSRLNDAWGEPFRYETDGVGYSIASNGPDRKFGTSDDIAIIRKGTEQTKPDVEKPNPAKPVQEVVSKKESISTTKAASGAKNEPGDENTSNLSLVEIPFSKDKFQSKPSGANQQTTKPQARSVALATCSFIGLLILAFFGFTLFSKCSIANKITRTLLSIPGILAVSLLAYWYVPVQKAMPIAQEPSENSADDFKGWIWSRVPGSRLLFINSNEKISGDCVQLVLNGKGKPYAGIALPLWLSVQRKSTITVAAKFDDNDTLQDPWIRAKNDSGIIAPWPMKDFIEAAEASRRFGITFDDKDRKRYTFTFNIDKLKSTLGPDRKYFMGGK